MHREPCNVDLNFPHFRKPFVSSDDCSHIEFDWPQNYYKPLEQKVVYNGIVSVYNNHNLWMLSVNFLER